MGKQPEVRFYRKENSINGLRGHTAVSPGDQYSIKKVVELSPAMFRVFSENLWFEYTFVSANARMGMARDNETWNCFLVRSPENKQGILVSPEGYDYARYAAVVANHAILDLRGILVEVQRATDEIGNIQGLVVATQGSMQVADRQKLLCAIGEITEKSNGAVSEKLYLWNNALACFAGFYGRPAFVYDANGDSLKIGDVVRMKNGNTVTHQIISTDRDGNPVPSQAYIDSRGIVKSSGGEELIALARLSNFELCSCSDDYKKARTIAHQTEKSGPEKVRLER